MIHSLLSIPCVTLQGEQKRWAISRRALTWWSTPPAVRLHPAIPRAGKFVAILSRTRPGGARLPCNQFGSQEPGSPLEIANFCSLNYGVSFPLFSKIDVNGPGAHPLFNELKRLAPGILGSRRIKWNFTKFLLTADGQRVTRFAPITKPERLFDRIETLLK